MLGREAETPWPIQSCGQSQALASPVNSERLAGARECSLSAQCSPGGRGRFKHSLLGAAGPGAPVFTWQVHLPPPLNPKALETAQGDLPSLVLQGTEYL